LAATRKVDGKYARNLRDEEMAQIAGRAGRHTRDGTFGMTGFAPDLDEASVNAIENHTFSPIEAICWRNSHLDFTSPKSLLKSLDQKPDSEILTRGRTADDMHALTDMLSRDDVMARATAPDTVRLLWDVCQIPDFRKVLSDDHHEFAARIFEQIVESGQIDAAWMSSQIERFDNIDGDVDTLMARLAHIRTWTYLTHKSEWMVNAIQWQNQTRDIEDRLSDALHAALTKRFVDKRNALFSDALTGDKELLAGVRHDGSVIVEGQEIGHLKALRFIADDTLLADKGARTKKIMNAALKALRPEITRRLKLMVNWAEVGAETGRFTLGEDGQIFWQANKTNPLPGEAVAFIQKGQGILRPEVKIIAADTIDDGQKSTLKNTIDEWLQSHLKEVLAPLFNLMDEEGEHKLEGSAKGIGFQLYENLGVIHRGEIESLVPDLTPEHRTALRRKRVKMGPILVFMPELVKPAAVNMRALLWGLWTDQPLPMARPADGRVSVTVDPKDIDRNFFRSIGYPVFGSKAIRIDMLDRVITDIYDSSKNWQFQAKHQYMEWLGCGEEDLYAILESMGFKRQKADVVKAEEAKTENTTDKKADEVSVSSETAEIAKSEVTSEDTNSARPAVENKETTAQEKPELATFWLKKGKISDRPKPKNNYQARDNNKGDNKPYKKGKGKPHQKPKSHSYSAKPKKDEIDDDSPFAILKQLQK
jgi:ATP-dependent RNA helicase SUPV3L1/SUV3